MYYLIDRVTCDEWVTPLGHRKKEAIREAKGEWNSLSPFDKKRRTFFAVVKCEDDSEDTLYDKGYDTIEIFKEI